MKTQDVYLKFKAEDQEYYYCSVESMVKHGTPIDGEGIEMKQVDDNLYIIDVKVDYKVLGE